MIALINFFEKFLFFLQDNERASGNVHDVFIFLIIIKACIFFIYKKSFVVRASVYGNENFVVAARTLVCYKPVFVTHIEPARKNRAVFTADTSEVFIMSKDFFVFTAPRIRTAVYRVVKPLKPRFVAV